MRVVTGDVRAHDLLDMRDRKLREVVAVRGTTDQNLVDADPGHRRVRSNVRHHRLHVGWPKGRIQVGNHAHLPAGGIRLGSRYTVGHHLRRRHRLVSDAEWTLGSGGYGYCRGPAEGAWTLGAFSCDGNPALRDDILA